jgi:transketolase
MRKAFIDTLLELAEQDPRVFLLTADLGWSVLETFARRFPRRFLNVGVAEQNLIGVATGLARTGYQPFAYSIATFISMRCYEQFRDGPVLHRLPVRLIGMGGGFSYGHAGPTHFGMEDLALARLQPAVTALAPADSAQTRAVVKCLPALPGPAYLRVDKTEEPDIPGLAGRFAIDTPELVRPGRGLIFVTTGSIARAVLRAAELLERDGLAAAVCILAHLGFQAAPALIELLRPFAHAVAVEEAFTTGGLGSLVAETIAEHLPSLRLLRLGIAAPLDGITGSRDYLRQRHGLDAEGIATRVRRFAQASS